MPERLPGYKRSAAEPPAAAKALRACGHPSLQDAAFVEANDCGSPAQFYAAVSVIWGALVIHSLLLPCF